jgi:XapX domain-containing protein
MSLRRERRPMDPEHAARQPHRALALYWRRCANWPDESPKPSPTKGKQMTAFLLSAAVGLLVGVIYGLLSVKSPAPPVIALVGLLAILVGEQIPPFLRHMWGA